MVDRPPRAEIASSAPGLGAAAGRDVCQVSRQVLRAFAMRLRDLRGVRGWTQETLAERTSLSADSVRRIETAKMAPSLVTLQKLATGLGLPLSRLVEGIPEQSRCSALVQLVNLIEGRSEREVTLLLRVAETLFSAER